MVCVHRGREGELSGRRQGPFRSRARRHDADLYGRWDRAGHCRYFEDTATQAVLASNGYTYDNDANMTSQTIALGANSGAGMHAYGYDQADRLTSWTNPAVQVTNYVYDAAGNRTASKTRFDICHYIYRRDKPAILLLWLEPLRWVVATSPSLRTTTLKSEPGQVNVSFVRRRVRATRSLSVLSVSERFARSLQKEEGPRIVSHDIPCDLDCGFDGHVLPASHFVIDPSKVDSQPVVMHELSHLIDPRNEEPENDCLAYILLSGQWSTGPFDPFISPNTSFASSGDWRYLVKQGLDPQATCVDNDAKHRRLVTGAQRSSPPLFSSRLLIG